MSHPCNILQGQYETSRFHVGTCMEQVRLGASLHLIFKEFFFFFESLCSTKQMFKIQCLIGVDIHIILILCIK